METSKAGQRATRRQDHANRIMRYALANRMTLAAAQEALKTMMTSAPVAATVASTPVHHIIVVDLINANERRKVAILAERARLAEEAEADALGAHLAHKRRATKLRQLAA